VRCGLYSSPDGFRVPGREMRGAVARIRNGHATCVFNGLPAGTYAVAVFHAEHNEAQMETGLFGKPKQGYGFSRNPSSAFGPPSFASAAAEILQRSGAGCAASTPDEWATALAKLCADSGLRARLGARGRSYCVEHYSIAAWLPTWLAILDDVRRSSSLGTPTPAAQLRVAGES
jgi:glycosyltransferase involved in cell wall biosynthesis